MNILIVYVPLYLLQVFMGILVVVTAFKAHFSVYKKVVSQ